MMIRLVLAKSVCSGEMKDIHCSQLLSKTMIQKIRKLLPVDDPLIEMIDLKDMNTEDLRRIMFGDDDLKLFALLHKGQ